MGGFKRTERKGIFKNILRCIGCHLNSAACQSGYLYLVEQGFVRSRSPAVFFGGATACCDMRVTSFISENILFSVMRPRWSGASVQPCVGE